MHELAAPAPAPATRCAVHPARPASQLCPSCGLPCCQADVQGARHCLACRPRAVASAATNLERAVRGGLALMPVVLIGAWIGTQYVHAHVFSIVVPGLIGVVCAAAAMSAAGRGGIAMSIGEAAAGALLAVALSDSFDFGTGLFSPLGQAGPPYLAALVGVAVWPLLFAGGRGR